MKPLVRIAGATALAVTAVTGVGQLQGCALGVVAAGGAGAAMALDRRSAGTLVDDQSLELKISKGINDEPGLGEQAHINVTSYDYEVLLTGEAPTAAMRDRAVDVARHTVLVKKVYNEIAVAPPTTLKSRSKDTLITGDIKARLVRNDEVSAANVKVVTERRAVYLMGLIRHAEGAAAVEVARFAKDVARVVPLFEYTD